MQLEILEQHGEFALAIDQNDEHVVLFRGALCTLATEGLDREPGFDRALEWAQS